MGLSVTELLFCDKRKFKRLNMDFDIDTLLIYTFWYEFSNDFDAQSDFGKDFVSEKLVSWNHSYLNYALVK